jgi:hypothetical protein
MEHRRIGAADDQQRRGGHLPQVGSGQIRPAAARDTAVC